MTDQTSQPEPVPAGEPPAAAPMPPPDPAATQPQGAPPAGWQPPPPGMLAPATGPIGQVRSTGTCILLFIVTLGIYSLVWYYKVHDEMKRHTGDGLGGGVALIIGFFVSIAMAFLTPSEVGKLYKRRGQAEPVTGLTGFWVLLPLAGAIVWFVKVNGALNEYWRSLGAPA